MGRAKPFVGLFDLTTLHIHLPVEFSFEAGTDSYQIGVGYNYERFFRRRRMMILAGYEEPSVDVKILYGNQAE